MSDFSLELNEDQLQIVKWVHEFAENVVRPAGPRVGRAGGDALADHPGGRQDRPLLLRLHHQRFSDPTASSCAWPTRRWPGVTPASRLAIFGSTLAVAGIVANGTPEQIDGVGPPVLRHPRRRQAGRLRRVRARRRFRRVLAADPGRLRRGEGRVGAQRHQDLDHQRRHRQHRTWWCVGRPRAAGAGARPASSCPEGTPGISQGQKFKKMGIRASPHRRGRPRRLPGPRALPARRQGEARRAPGPGPGGQADVDARPPWPRSRRPARSSAPRRWASPAPPTSTRSSTPRSARPVRPGHHREPGDRLQAGRHEEPGSTPPGCWCGAPRGWAATGKEFTTGEGSMSKLYAGETAV